MARAMLVLGLGLALGGCFLSHEGPEGEGGLCTPGPEAPPGGAVDLLLVVDPSPTMENEQQELAEALPGFVDGVLSGDPDGDGVADLPPATSVQIGVVSTDMGTGGHPVPTCPDARRGDDGVLLQRCGGTTPWVRVCEPGTEDVACLVPVGSEGCGFEQPLEAALKALSPAASPIVFRGGTAAHGDGENAGFVRPGSVLAVLVVSDEDDCSALDPELFVADSRHYREHWDRRCFSHPEAMHPVARYVDGLLALRRHPSRLVFSFLGGVPPDLERAGWEDALSDPRMDPTVSPTRLPAACRARDGKVAPAPRLTEVAGRLSDRGAGGVGISLCHEDLGAALIPLARAIARAIPAG